MRFVKEKILKMGNHLIGPSKKYVIILRSYPHMKQTNKPFLMDWGPNLVWNIFLKFENVSSGSFVCLFVSCGGNSAIWSHTSWRGLKGAYPFSIREVLCGSGEQQTHVFLTEAPIGNRGTAGNRHMLYKQRYYWPHQSIQGSPAQFTNSILKSRSPHSPFKYLLIPPLCGSLVATLIQARVLR